MKISITSLLLILSLFASAQPEVYTDTSLGKMGFRDMITGKNVIPCTYDYAYGFWGNTTLVREDTIYSIINKKGKKLYTFSQHQDVGLSAVPDLYFSAHGKQFIVYDSLGKEVFSLIADRFDRWGENHEPGIWVATKGNKSGFVSTRGKVLIPMEYEADNYQETFSCDGNLYFHDSALFKLKHDGKWGVMSMYGKVVLPFEYESIETVQYDTRETELLFAAGIKDGKHVFINSQQKDIYLDFDTCAGFFNIMTQAVLLKGDKVLLYDVIKNVRVDSFPFVSGRQNDHGRSSTADESHAMKIHYKGKYTLIDTKGRVIYPFAADPAEALYVKNKLFFAIYRGGVIALFDAKLKQLTPFNFISMDIYEDQIYATDINTKEVKISETGKVIFTGQ